MSRTTLFFLEVTAVLALLTTLSGCGKPASTNMELKATSRNNLYVLTMRPEAGTVVINHMHNWQLVLTNTGGQAISHAKFHFSGGMPHHNHGLPTQPQVTQEMGNGHYLLEGMRFSMPGWWEIKVTIDGNQGQDSVLFNTIIPEPGYTQ